MYIFRIDIRPARGISGGNVFNLCNTATGNFQGVDLCDFAILLINALIVVGVELPCSLIIDIRITSFVRRDIIHRRSFNGVGIGKSSHYQTNDK
jgi:hypothetical protein